MPPGTLKLIRATGNPYGADDNQLFLLVGNATVAPVTEIVPAKGVALPSQRADLSTQPCRVKVLHINDLHGHIARFTQQEDQPILSRIVSRLRDVRRRYRDDPNTAVLFMSAGDDLVGAVFDELVGGGTESFALHAGYRLYSAAGVDVSVLGNHDLDLGTKILAQAIKKDAHFPVLSANLEGCRYLNGLKFPAAIMVTKGIRIGIIGLTTPGQSRQQQESNMVIINPIRAIHNLLPVLKPLCDVMIILSHLGYSLDGGHGAAVRDAGDVELARSLPRGSVHLIVGGHTHHILNEQGLTVDDIVNGIPIVQAGNLGRFLGEVDIVVREDGTAVTNARLTSTASLSVDEQFERENVQPLMDIARPLFTKKLGQVADDPDLSTFAVRSNFAASESILANFVADALVARCQDNHFGIDMAVVDASAMRSGLPVGDELTFGDWFDLMPFADVLRIYWLTGEQLQMLIQDNAIRIDLPGEPHTDRGFVHFSRQVRYTIVIGSSRKDIRVTDITVNGVPLDEQMEESFQLVCSSFTRQSAGQWEKYAQRRLGLPTMDFSSVTHMDTPLYLRKEMVAYIMEHGGVTREGGAIRDGRLRIFASKNAGAAPIKIE